MLILAAFLFGILASVITMPYLGANVSSEEANQLASICADNQGLHYATMTGLIDGDNVYHCVNGAEFHLPHQQSKD